MRRFFLLLVCTGIAFFANAQSSEYKPFKFDISLGYAIPPDNNGGGTKAGITFTAEPHYRLSDALAVGLRIDVAGLGYEQNDPNNAGNSNVKVDVLTSYSPTVEFYLANGGVRPFIGGGAGLFIQESVNYDSNTNTSGDVVKGGTRFGAFPRVGIEIGHFRISAEYDVAGNNSNFVAFKIGGFFGGGKR